MIKRALVALFVVLTLTSCNDIDINTFERTTGIEVPQATREALRSHIDSAVAAGEDRSKVEAAIGIAAYRAATPQTTKRLSPAQARELGRRMTASAGWNESQFNCLDHLWGKKESGWRWNADSPSSSAYGIPQALPGHKMGPGWQDDVEVQIRWGLSYIRDRYGFPCAALSASNSKGWY